MEILQGALTEREILELQIQQALQQTSAPPEATPVGVVPDEESERLTLEREIAAAQAFEQTILQGQTPDQQRVLQQQMQQATAGPPQHGEAGDVSLTEFLTIGGKSFASGLASGLILPFEHVPVVGKKFVQPYLSPIVQRLNQEALETTLEAVGMMGDQDLPGLAKVALTGGQIAGSLTGIMLPFTALMRLSRLLFVAQGANVAGLARLAGLREGQTLTNIAMSPLQADMAGFFAFGAATKEPGLVQSILSGGHEGARTHSEDWLKDLEDRLKTGVFSAGELGALGVMFRVIGKGVTTTRRNLAQARATRTSLSREAQIALQQGEGGASLKARVSEALEAGVGADAVQFGPNGEIIGFNRTAPGFDDLLKLIGETEEIAASAEALRVIDEAGQPIEALVAARKANPEGIVTVDRVPAISTFRQRVEQTQAEQAQRLIAERNVTTGEAHSMDEISALVREDVPLFKVYGTGLRDQSILSGALGQVTRGRKGGEVLELLLRPSSQAKIRRVETWDELLQGRTPNAVLRDLEEELVVITQGKGSVPGRPKPEVVVLDESILQSARPVPDEILAAKAKPLTADTAEIVAQVGDDVPLEVTLARRNPEMVFVTRPSAGEEGLQDVLSYWRGAPVEDDLIKAWQAYDGARAGTRFLPGQSVAYQGKSLWTYEGLVTTGRDKGKLVIRGAEGGKAVHVSPESPLIRAAGMGTPRTVGFQDALFEEFYRDVLRGLEHAAEAEPGLRGYRQLIKQKTGALGRVDKSQKGNNILFPEEVDGVVPALETGAMTDRGFATGGLDVVQPDPLLGHADALWSDFLAKKGLAFAAEESSILKTAMFARARARLFEEAVPAHEKVVLENIRSLQVEAIERGFVENPLDTMAALEGYSSLVLHDGRVQLTKIGTRQVSLHPDEQAAMRAMRNASPFAEDLQQGSGYVGLSMPAEVNGRIAGVTPEADLLYNRRAANAADIAIAADNPATYGVPIPTFTNMLRWASEVSTATGLPINRTFEKMIAGQKQFATDAFPFIERVNTVSKGMSLPEREAVGRFLQLVENEPAFVNAAARDALAIEKGLSAKQIAYLNELTGTWDAMFPQLQRHFGMTFEQNYLFNYFPRLQRYMQGDGTDLRFLDRAELFGVNKGRTFERFVSNRTREGTLANTEMDPTVVMKRFVNGFFHDVHVQPHVQELKRFATMQVKDLPAAQAKQLAGTTVRAGPGAGTVRGPNSPVMPGPVNQVLNEVIAHSYGQVGQGVDKTVETIRNIFRLMKVDIPAGDVKEAISIGTSAWYGAAMAFRLRPITRNTVQNMFNLYPRIGGRAMGSGYRRAVTEDGWAEALAGKAFRLESRGVPAEDIVFKQNLDKLQVTATEGSNIVGPVMAALTRGGMAAGQVSRSVAQRGLKWFGGSDTFNRVWAYHAQIDYIKPLLKNLKSGQMSRETFRTRAMEGWGQAERTEFMRILDLRGEDKALQYAGRTAADWTNYVYVQSTQPLFMQSTLGRVAGIFGTWPIWQKDMLMTYMRNTSGPAKARMLARYGAVTGSIGAIGWSWGVNLQSWIGPMAPFGWFGSPLLQMTTDTYEAVKAPWAAKPKAMARAMSNMGRLAFPGEVLINSDIKGGFEAAARQGDLKAVWASMLLGRPTRHGPNLFLWSQQEALDEEGQDPFTPLIP